MSSSETAAALRAHADTLRGLGRDSIAHGLEHGAPLAVDASRYSEPLRAPRACFVTLRRSGALRGCVGGLEAERPLVGEVAERAFGAAFRDPRFPPLAREELEDLDLHLSVLGPLEPVSAPSERRLGAALRPGLDGLVLAAAGRRATFLPAVWESLPEAGDFVRELKRKAGLPAGEWPRELRAWRYEVVSLD